MLVLFWPLLGALIGVAAAQRKGFSVAGGVIGGLLLGPLAFLMFFVSGIATGDARRQCPFCAEFIKREAIVCRYCHHELEAAPVAVPSRRRAPSGDLLRGAGLTMLLLAGGVLAGYVFFVLGI